MIKILPPQECFSWACKPPSYNVKYHRHGIFFSLVTGALQTLCSTDHIFNRAKTPALTQRKFAYYKETGWLFCTLLFCFRTLKCMDKTYNSKRRFTNRHKPDGFFSSVFNTTNDKNAITLDHKRYLYIEQHFQGQCITPKRRCHCSGYTGFFLSTDYQTKQEAVDERSVVEKVNKLHSFSA